MRFFNNLKKWISRNLIFWEMCTKWKSILTNFCHMRRNEYFCNFTITKCICTDYFKRRIIRNFNCLNLWTSVKRFLTNFCDITWNCILDELLNTFTPFISYFEFCSNSFFIVDYSLKKRFYQWFYLILEYQLFHVVNQLQIIHFWFFIWLLSKTNFLLYKYLWSILSLLFFMKQFLFDNFNYFRRYWHFIFSWSNLYLIILIILEDIYTL